jgi:hypothetical protein
MGQFEVGQQELIDVHNYTYLLDMAALIMISGQSDYTDPAPPGGGGGGGGSNKDRQPALATANKGCVAGVNQLLLDAVYFSTQRRSDYDKLLSKEEFASSKKYLPFFLKSFMSVPFFSEFLGLGFQDQNPREKDINSLTITSFYGADLMRGQAFRYTVSLSTSPPLSLLLLSTSLSTSPSLRLPCSLN